MFPFEVVTALSDTFFKEENLSASHFSLSSNRILDARYHLAHDIREAHRFVLNLLLSAYS